MPVRDRCLALFVVMAWGFNFVVIKIGLSGMPPFLLAGLRYTLVALPAILLVKRPQIPLRWLAAYGITISFGQFTLLFIAFRLGMPAGISSLVLQSQAFFTVLLGVFLMGEKMKWHHLASALITIAGMVVLAAPSGGQFPAGISLLTMTLTLGAALCWALGNISSKIIMRDNPPPIMSLVVWSALIAVPPFFLCSWLFDDHQAIINSVVHLHLPTLLTILYQSFIATIMGYAIWGSLLSRYETWRVAPLSLLVPIFGMLSATFFLGEKLSSMQIIGALIVVAGLLLNVFFGAFSRYRQTRAMQRNRLSDDR